MKEKHIWTSEDEMFLRNNYGKITNAEIAEVIGCSESAVTRHSKLLGPVGTRPYKELDERQIQYIIDNHKTRTPAEIAIALQRSKSTIVQKMEKLGLPTKFAYEKQQKAKQIARLAAQDVENEHNGKAALRRKKAAIRNLQTGGYVVYTDAEGNTIAVRPQRRCAQEAFYTRLHRIIFRDA